MLRIFVLGLVLVGWICALGCESIAGIEDRVLVAVEAGASAGGSGSESKDSELCKQYCEDVTNNCVDDDLVYASVETCLATCALLPEGDPTEEDPSGNTVACRARNAELAGSTGETNVHCPRAGPGGDGRCGDNCESYCMLFDQACADDSVRDCERKCAALYVDDDPKYNYTIHHDGDYLQCRLVHVVSATVDPQTHCWHSAIAPNPQGGERNPCADPPGTTPDCERYCDAVMVACVEDNAVYESRDQCLDVCEALPKGDATDVVEDSVGCRHYHTYNSLEDPATHCPHASASGDGHCGEDNCGPYCHLLAAACPTEFEEAFETAEECTEACSDLDGAAADTYSLVSDTGNNVRCRLRNVARAFASPSACEAAFGGGECR